MKILIVTQAVDSRSDSLGFFINWINEIALKATSVTVIALSLGDFTFPDNVRVMSLGKEFGKSRLKYIYRFIKYIIRERKNYDNVFVHMNQEYVLIGAIFWKIFRKPIYLWRNHAKGNILTRMSILLSNVVFATSPDSYVARFKKTRLMPVGIDLKAFKPKLGEEISDKKYLMFGRISPVKKVHLLIEALRIIKERGINISLDIVGNASAKDSNYLDEIKNKIKLYELSNVKILPSVRYEDVPETLRKYSCLINLTPSGSLDKTIFEALASGLPVVITNSYFINKLPDDWIIKNETDAQEIAEKIISMNDNPQLQYQKNIETISSILQANSLESLMNKLFSIFYEKVRFYDKKDYQ